MESRHDSETAERILYNMRPKELVRTHMHVVSWFWLDFVWQAVCLQVEVIKKAYMQGEVEVEEPEEGEDGEEEEHSASPRNVGHNIYILAHQVRSKHCVKTLSWSFFTIPAISHSPPLCQPSSCQIYTYL